jgi:hypothetical protein
MKDKDFLMCIHNRLANVHGENTNADYMLKLRAIIARTPSDQFTPNCSVPNDSDLVDPLGR